MGCDLFAYDYFSCHIQERGEEGLNLSVMSLHHWIEIPSGGGLWNLDIRKLILDAIQRGYFSTIYVNWQRHQTVIFFPDALLWGRPVDVGEILVFFAVI